MSYKYLDQYYLQTREHAQRGFIAAVFFYLYNKTITSMSKYHNKLVLSHNISIALKIADSLSDAEKKVNKSLIISELMKDINTYMIKNEITQ